VCGVSVSTLTAVLVPQLSSGGGAPGEMSPARESGNFDSKVPSLRSKVVIFWKSGLFVWSSSVSGRAMKSGFCSSSLILGRAGGFGHTVQFRGSAGGWNLRKFVQNF
jgi:hypothetical protein